MKTASAPGWSAPITASSTCCSPGSLHSGTIKASEVLRLLAPGCKPTPTGKVIKEIGRIDRSAYLSSYFTDELLRRRINTQLGKSPATTSPGRSSTVRKASSGSPTVKARKISLGHWDWCSTS
jgi:hypothetical protein